MLAVTLRALHKLWCPDGMMGATTIAPTLGYLTFWQRGHNTISLISLIFLVSNVYIGQQSVQRLPARIQIGLRTIASPSV
jgi:hypothetical protein